MEKFIFSYKKSTNTTTIKDKTRAVVNTITKPGFVVVNISTEEDEVKVSY